MSWPAFDLAEAVNQAISTLGTLVGVFVGGWFAFRLALRQLRHERALDRRLKSLENLVGLVDSYGTSIATFVSLEREVRKGVKERERVRDLALDSATSTGRQVAAAVQEVRLYSGDLPVLDTVRDKQTETYLFTWTEARGSARTDEGLAHLDTICSELNSAHKTLVRVLRAELVLPPPGPPRKMSIRLPQTPIGPSATT